MNRCVKFLLIFTSVVFGGTFAFGGPTMISGNVSGAWDLSGSPYYITADSTVPTGSSLTIDPGVQVILGEGISFTIYGTLTAVGTANNHIIFKAVNNDVKYNQIHVINGSSTTTLSEFVYCDFSNAEKALYLHAYGRIINDVTVLQTNVQNCTFSGSDIGIYAHGEGHDYSQYMTPKRAHASVDPVIKGCNFESNGDGITMYMQGDGSSWYSAGTTAAIVQNNVFLNSSGAALNMLAGSHPSHSGSPSFFNNTIVNCERGAWIQDSKYDATIENNIMYGTITAIEKVGTTGSAAYFNCLYGNTVNFIGYPSTYGDIVMVNANGEPCDICFNIFLDPKLVSDDFHITADSPCIDAGSSDNAPDLDIDGDSRPQLYGTDIGADEFYKKELFAKAGPDLSVCTQICEQVTLNGSKSYALSDTITSYDWTLAHRSESTYDQTATGSNPTISNLALGIYDVTLTITDDGGGQATDLMVLTVRDDCDLCSVMQGDLNGDGDVDGNDLAIFSHYYGSKSVSED